LAAELGLGVLIMRPFGAADLMRIAPPAAELAPLQQFGIRTWSQALLEWGLSHTATTVSIPPPRSRAGRPRTPPPAMPSHDDEHRQLISRLAGA
jgi:hypothetical protein